MGKLEKNRAKKKSQPRSQGPRLGEDPGSEVEKKLATYPPSVNQLSERGFIDFSVTWFRSYSENISFIEAGQSQRASNFELTKREFSS